MGTSLREMLKNQLLVVSRFWEVAHAIGGHQFHISLMRPFYQNRTGVENGNIYIPNLKRFFMSCNYCGAARGHIFLPKLLSIQYILH